MSFRQPQAKRGLAGIHMIINKFPTRSQQLAPGITRSYMFQAKQFESINGVEGLSEKLMKEHYKLYEGYVKKADEISEKLKTVDYSTANATYSDLRALKLGFSFAVDAIKSHELYFENLDHSKIGQQI